MFIASTRVDKTKTKFKPSLGPRRTGGPPRTTPAPSSSRQSTAVPPDSPSAVRHVALQDNRDSAASVSHQESILMPPPSISAGTPIAAPQRSSSIAPSKSTAVTGAIIIVPHRGDSTGAVAIVPSRASASIIVPTRSVPPSSSATAIVPTRASVVINNSQSSTKPSTISEPSSSAARTVISTQESNVPDTQRTLVDDSPDREPEAAAESSTAGVDRSLPPTKRLRGKQSLPSSDNEEIASSTEASTSRPRPKKRRAPARKPQDREPWEGVDEEGSMRPTRPRKRKSTAGALSDIEGESGAEGSASGTLKRKRKSRSRDGVKATRKSRRKRKTPEEIEQEEADAEGKIHDPTAVSMGELIEDLPVGRSTSHRVDRMKKLEESRKRDRVIRARLKEQDKRISMGLSKEVDEDAEDEAAAPPPLPTIEEFEAQQNIEDKDEDDDDDWMKGFKASSFVPQVRLDNAGNIVTDDLRLEIERDAEIREEDYEHVTELENDRFVNSMTHSKKNKGGSRWSRDETATFFHYLSMYGTDFECIARLMPLRSRSEIKKKFNAEDKKNPALVTDCILHKTIPIDLSEHGQLTGKDFSGPAPESNAPEAVGSPRISEDDDAMEVDPFAAPLGTEAEAEAEAETAVDEDKDLGDQEDAEGEDEVEKADEDEDEPAGDDDDPAAADVRTSRSPPPPLSSGDLATSSSTITPGAFRGPVPITIGRR